MPCSRNLLLLLVLLYSVVGDGDIVDRFRLALVDLMLFSFKWFLLHVIIVVVLIAFQWWYRFLVFARFSAIISVFV